MWLKYLNWEVPNLKCKTHVLCFYLTRLTYLFSKLLLIMKAIKLVKKVVKWYFEHSAKTYNWVPTGTIPYGKE